MLKYRLMSGTSIIALLIFTTIYSNSVLGFCLVTVSVALIASLALLEFYNMMQKKGMEPMVRYGLYSSIAFIFITALNSCDWYTNNYSIFENLLVIANVLAIPLFIIVAFVLLVFTNKVENGISRLLSTLGGFFCITLLLSYVLKILLSNYNVSSQELDKNIVIDGRYMFLYFVVTVKSTDIGAYFIGTLIGKKRLCPNISPKKSVEGSIGGVLFSVILGMLLFFTVEPINDVFLKVATLFNASLSTTKIIAAIIALSLNIVLSILGQIGDLIESIWKRDAEIKDSASYIPGMGGVCDVIDSLLLPAPLMYAFIIFTMSI